MCPFANGIYPKTTSHREHKTLWDGSKTSEMGTAKKKTEDSGFHFADIYTYVVRSNVNSISHEQRIPHHLQITKHK